jgi:uncharacterized sulfatase
VHAAPPPHIILYLADDLGMANLHAYHSASAIPTPEIDRMASEGCRFYDVHAPAAVCTPTRYGVLTGRYPFRSRLTKGVQNAAYEEPLLKGEGETIADMLKRGGYATAAFGKWHLGLDFANRAGNGIARPGVETSIYSTKDVDFSKPIRHHAVDHGFDYFFGLPSSVNHDPYSFIENDHVTVLPKTFRPQYTPPQSGGPFREGWLAEGWDDALICPRILDRAVSRIRSHLRQSPDKPLFVYYASPAPHFPWVPPPAAFNRKLYGVGGNEDSEPRHNDMVVMNDVEVGALRRALEDPNNDGQTNDSVLNRTLFIITSDNGACVGYFKPYRGKKGSIYEGGHRVPFIVRWSRNIQPGSRSDALFGLQDLYATFAELTGTAIASNAATDSRSVLGALSGGPTGVSTLLMQKAGGSPAFAWRDGSWKLVETRPDEAELFDLANDPGESHDLAKQEPARVQAMRTTLHQVIGDYRERVRSVDTDPESGPATPAIKRRAKKAASSAGAVAPISPLTPANQPRVTAPPTRPNVLLYIADDMSWAHTSVDGFPVVKTPNFDRVANSGVRFSRTFCSSPSCTPSRGALLTGQAFCRLEEGASLLSTLPSKFAVYPDLLEKAGYAVGCSGKGWDPGDWRPGGRTRNPAGPAFQSFEAFLQQLPPETPFCFWAGSGDPHRPYKEKSGIESGMDPSKIIVPPIVPDTPEIRSDLADYLFEVQRFDQNLGVLLAELEKRGLLQNTLLAVTSDNGMPYPRGKCSLYDWGTHMPLAIAWPARIPGQRRVDDFVSLTDLAPTFLEATGVTVPPDMTGRSLLPLLLSGQNGWIDKERNRAFFGRERHDSYRLENGQPVGYPMRAMRTDQYLYIRNFHPGRFPGGDDPARNQDNDRGPAKTFVVTHKDDPAIKPFYERAYGRRPAEELYDLVKDPGQLSNVADDQAYAQVRPALQAELERWMTAVHDPRRPKGPDPDVFDRYPVHGKPNPTMKAKPPPRKTGP